VSLIIAVVGIFAEWAIVFAIAKLAAWPDVLLPALTSIAVAGMSVSMWRNPKNEWLSTPKGCLKSLGIIPVVGALVFSVDMIIGQVFHPLTNPFAAALETGMFGGALTLFATACAEIAALGTLLRSLLLRRLGVSHPT
jgi:hypothetical protein